MQYSALLSGRRRGGSPLEQSKDPSTTQVPSLQLLRLWTLRVCVGPGTCTYRTLGYFLTM